ncbi:hypothetical protein BC629DRAFT_532191 [Irpex lacteus]|nr:hypothetical protein BC629DRAFT_532191 [Irpex lacteus]
MALRGIENHPDLWFEDGNVVLIAEYTGFRCSRECSRGTRRSFETCSNTTTYLPEESFDGCPVVCSAGGSAEEVAIVLDIRSAWTRRDVFR